jgi:hypothetical protein
MHTFVPERGVKAMFLRNVPTIERIIRVLLGLGLLAGALLWFGSTKLGWLVGASGLIASLTGLLGWCPMCALGGRKPC